MKKKIVKNPVAIVTGSGQGIGLCIARYFIAVGVRVVIAEKNPVLGKKAQQLLGPESIFIQTDVSSEPSVRFMIQQTVKRAGQIDIWLIMPPLRTINPSKS
jgi:NAD(P)-dependent dehydrogenase (short-subunit alcohol dehydrogenase family)